MDRPRMIAAFNEWMRRYIETPEAFAREFQTVQEFLAEEQDGKEPGYGERSAAYILKIDSDLSTAAEPS